MQLHDIQRNTPLKSKKRVGRGGRRGKTSGRGHKGQKSRAGGTPRPELRDTIKKIPKLRGHGKNRPRTVIGSKKDVAVVNLGAIDAAFASSDVVSPTTLVEHGLVARAGGRMPRVKVLSQGTVSKPLTFEGCMFSETARKKVEEAGGTIK